MGGDNTSQHGQHHKRKRSSLEDGAEKPAAKKPASDVCTLVSNSPQLKEDFRAQVRAVYSNYSTLLKGKSHDSGDASAFQAILESTQGMQFFK